MTHPDRISSTYLRRTALGFRDHPDSVSTSPVPADRQPMDFSLVSELWQPLKTEFYAITAVLADDIKTRMMSGLDRTDDKRLTAAILRPKNGIIEPFDNFSTFLMEQGLDALRIEREKERLPRHAAHARTPLWKRYRDIDVFLRTQVRGVEGNLHDTMLIRGINNAANFMANCTEVLPFVYGDGSIRTDNDILLWQAILRNSFSTVASSAMMEIGPFTALRDLLMSGLEENPNEHFNPAFFQLSPTRKGPALTIREYVTESAQAAAEATYTGAEEFPEPHIGCPAMVNFGDGSFISALWDWIADRSPVLYRAAQTAATIPPDAEAYHRFLAESSSI